MDNVLPPQVNQIIPKVKTGWLSHDQSMISKTQAGSHDQPVDFRAYAVNLVFKEFKDNWPRKFLSIWKTPEEMTASKKQWMKSFQTTGWLTPELFQIGLTEVKREQWPPDNPAEFLKYCHVQPRSVGAPEPLVAFRKALMNCHAQNDMPRWGHKCVYWAAVRTGLSELCVKGEALREQFYDNYAHALDEHQALGPMPVAMLPKQRELPTVEERTLAAEWLHSIKGAL